MLLAPVAARAVDVTSSRLPDGRVGVDYEATLTVSGGRPPYSFSVVGSLPSGLELVAAGRIAGVPLFSGRWVFNACVRDSTGATACGQVEVTIFAAKRLRIDAPLPQSTWVDEPVEWVAVPRGGIPPYIWTVGGLPPGLDAHEEGGALHVTGAVEEVGVYPFSVHLADSLGEEVRIATTLTVLAEDLEILTDRLPPAYAGESYEAYLHAPGATAFVIVTGAPPPGTAILSGGRIAGVPAGEPGSYAFIVEARGPRARGQRALSIQLHPVREIGGGAGAAPVGGCSAAGASPAALLLAIALLRRL